MTKQGDNRGRVPLDACGIRDAGDVYWNLPPAVLVEHAVRHGEGMLASNGALVCGTGEHTGRSPRAKFLVEEPSTQEEIWWGPVNQRMSPDRFDLLHNKVLERCRGRRLYVRDMYAGAARDSRMAIRIVTETAWHQLFAAQLFIKPQEGKEADVEPPFTVLSAPSTRADPARDGTPGEAFVVIHFGKRLVLIGGTAYAGEIKKSIFTIMNYLLPMSGILSMHCSANVGRKKDVALFFGLSGTGKTTLSADPARNLVGDDEHGWSDSGIFNIEGGCYAKCIGLTREKEPQIYEALRFGAVLENVVIDPDTRAVDYHSGAITENTRAAYPLEYIPGAVLPSAAGHPQNVVFLTCDAFGVLPPISRLTPEKAMYHFLSGYTAKVAGTERGVTEPKATFSACFGAPFLPLPPQRYATMLNQRLLKHDSRCWLINTGWTGGPYGEGSRIDLSYTRAMVRAALSGELDDMEYVIDPLFDLAVPRACPDVPRNLLMPRNCWRNEAAYESKARKLLELFEENFRKLGVDSAELAEAQLDG